MVDCLYRMDVLKRQAKENRRREGRRHKRSSHRFVDEEYMKRPLAMPWPSVDGAERLLKEEALERVNAVCVYGGRKRDKTKRKLTAAEEGVQEAFAFFDRYDRGYIMANDFRLAALDQGIDLDDEESQQLLWRVLEPSLSTMKNSQPDGATLSQFEKWIWLPKPK